MRRNTATPHWVDVPPDAERPAARRANAGGRPRPEPAPVPDRYAMIGLGENEVVIYDRENSDAWIQSTRAVPLAAPEAEGTTDG